MYKDPYNSVISTKLREEYKSLNKQIKEEKMKPNADMHRIYRLEEQKLIQGLFSNELGNAYGKYRNPW